MIPAGLRFGTAAADNVIIPSATSIDNLDPYTMIVRGTITTLTNGFGYWGKGFASNNSRHMQCIASGTTGNITITMDRATSDLTYTSNSTPLASLDTPFTLAMTFNSAGGAGLIIKAYISTNGQTFSTVTWGTTTGGSGAFQSDATRRLVLGNVALADSALASTMWEAHLLAEELSVTQLMQSQLRRFTKLGTTRGLWSLAEGPLLVRDRSGFGNHGIVTGAVPAGANFYYASPVTDSTRAVAPHVAGRIR